MSADRPTDREQQDERPKIKVTDRRSFDSAGNPRQPDAPDEGAGADESAGTSPAANRGPGDGSPVEAGGDPSDGVDVPAESGQPDDSAAPDGARQPDEPTPAAATTGAEANAESASPASTDDPRDAPTGAPDVAPEPADIGAEYADVDDDDGRIVTPSPSIAELPRDFSAFIENMYFEAMLFLGAVPDPRSGDIIEDVDLAKYKIDLLGMLQEKTEGNLSAEEKSQMEQVLYQLRMLYLQKTKTAKL